MKSLLVLLLSASFAHAQSLPYQYAYNNGRGWKEMMVFEQSPNNPNVILISLYSYVDAQVPFYKLKEMKPATDTKRTLAFIAQCQANEQATLQAVASSQASVQAVKDHYARQQSERQDQAEQERQELQQADRERRLQKLEKAEHDRLNRERSPWGN